MAGLREIKKRRTHAAIVAAAYRLFSEQGYRETTVLQIAESAEVALSTLQRYFPAKVDIVFAYYDMHAESATERILQRPQGEQTIDAIIAWIEETLPTIDPPYTGAFREGPSILAANPELHSHQRLRLARMEDIFAEGFARDLDQSFNAVQPRALATITLRSIAEIWATWYSRHLDDADDSAFDPSRALGQRTTYLRQLLETARDLLLSLPQLEP